MGCGGGGVASTRVPEQSIPPVRPVLGSAKIKPVNPKRLKTQKRRDKGVVLHLSLMSDEADTPEARGSALRA